MVKVSRHNSSFESGSTARSRVIRVVSWRLLPIGIEDANAKGPGEIGQYVPSEETFDGKGVGGRMFWQRYELFVHALRVSTEVVVNKVATGHSGREIGEMNCRDAPRLELMTPAISEGLVPNTVRLR